MTKKNNNKKTRNNRPVPNQAGPDTLVPVPLGTIQMIDKFMEASTGPIGLSRQIMESLQLSVDRAGLGRQNTLPDHPSQKAD